MDNLMIEPRHSDEEIELSIVSPMYNEEKNIDYFFAKLLPILESL